MDREKLLPGPLALVVLLAVTLGVLHRLLGAHFLDFDDNLFFGPDNPEFARGDLAAIFDPSRRLANVYLPVAHASLYFDWFFAGAQPWLAHLHSLVLHGLCGFVLARLLGRLGWPRLHALVAGGLFVLHPALVESAGWVASRKDLLAGLFVLLGLGQVAHVRGDRPALRVTLAVLCAVLALYSKATAMVLPVLVAGVILLLPRSARGPQHWLALALITVVTVLVTLHHKAIAEEQQTLVAAAGGRFAQLPGAFWHYVVTTFRPTRLDVLYPEVQTLERFRATLVTSSAAMLAVLVALCACLARASWRATGLCLAMALGALFPFNTALPASAIAAADRYLHLAVPFFAAALLAIPLARGGVALGLGTLLLLPLGWLAHERSAAFTNSEALWSASLARDPDNAVANLNLARERAAKDPVGARELLERGLAAARYPQHRFRALRALRDLASEQGRLEEAVLRAQEAVACLDAMPDSPEVRSLRILTRIEWGTAARAAGKEANGKRALGEARALDAGHPGVLALEAVTILSEAMDANGRMRGDDPRAAHVREIVDEAERKAKDSYDIRVLAGQVRAALGEFTRAHATFSAAKELAPARPGAWLGMVDLLLTQGLHEPAVETIKAALGAGVRDPNLYARLGLALTALRRLDEAQQWYEAYLRLKPGDVSVRKSLAAVLVTAAMPRAYQLKAADLTVLGERIRALDPDNPKGAILLGMAARLTKDHEKALVLLEKARTAMPDDAELARLYAETLRDRGYQLLLQGSRRAAAVEYFQRFAALKVPGVSTEGAVAILEEEWTESEGRGVAALERGELDTAEACFRRCRELVPERTWAFYLLGLVAARRSPPQWQAALDLFAQAEAGQRAGQLDVGLPVLYQVMALQKLGKPDAARAKAQGFLADPGASAPELVERVRKLAGS